jgi:hypothetical protein
MEFKDLVTLVAAVIAAIVSSVSLILNIRSQRRAEIRVAQRKALEPHLPECSEPQLDETVWEA